jgi:hypothetical protein
VQAGTNIYLDPRFAIRLSARLLGTAPTDGWFWGWAIREDIITPIRHSSVRI